MVTKEEYEKNREAVRQFEEKLEERGKFKEGERCEDCKEKVSIETLGERTLWFTFCKKCWFKRMLKYQKRFAHFILEENYADREQAVKATIDLEVIRGVVLTPFEVIEDCKNRDLSNLMELLFEHSAKISGRVKKYLEKTLYPIDIEDEEEDDFD